MVTATVEEVCHKSHREEPVVDIFVDGIKMQALIDSGSVSNLNKYEELAAQGLGAKFQA